MAALLRLCRRLPDKDGAEWYPLPDNRVLNMNKETIFVSMAAMNQSLTSNPSSRTTNNLPLNSRTSVNSFSSDAISLSARGGCMRNTTIPKNCFGGNKDLLMKSLSLVNNTHFFSLDSDYIFITLYSQGVFRHLFIKVAPKSPACRTPPWRG